jgi:hypothetical protein
VLYNPWGTINNPTPTYQWFVVPGATWYQLYVSGPSGVVFNDWLSSSDYTVSGDYVSYSPSMTLSPGNYTWWIRTFSGNGYGPWSNSMSFTQAASNLPGQATLISPSGSISTRTPTYTWRQEGPATWYYLWVNNPSGTRVVGTWVAESSACNGSTCSYTPSVTLGAGTHRWWIQTWNSYGFGPWSNYLDFTTPGLPAAATLVSPSGTITDSQPTYRWNAVPTATWYQLWVNGPSGNVISQWYTASSCGCSSGTGTCSITPTTTLSNGTHYWWIQTFNPYGYGPWSSSLSFYLSAAACGFDEQFNGGTAANWYRNFGSWSVVSNAWYYTPGVSGAWATSTYNGTYSNVYYRARFWRSGSDSNANRLMVRVSGATGSDGNPSNYYSFQYTRDGYYSVYRRVGGSGSFLQTWTYSPHINQGYAWNDIGAWLSGSSLWLNINGTWVWNTTDTSLSSGRAGLGILNTDSASGALWVDYATLTCLSGAAEGAGPPGADAISSEQQELNAAAAADPIGDENGLP